VRIINFEGTRHVFPADATDEEIAAALSVPTGGLKPNGKINYGQVNDAEELAMLKTQLAQTKPDDHGEVNADGELSTAGQQLRNRIALLQKRVQSAPPAARPVASQGDVRRYEPAEPRASQADVRAAEPKDAEPLYGMEKQRANEEAFERARQQYLKQHGVLPRGKPLAQSISEASGVPDPATTRDENMIDEAAETGKVDYESTPGYTPLKMAAGIGGFAVGGPVGATMAESGVRWLTLSQNLDKAVKAGAITEDRAAAILQSELATGGAIDAGWNFGVPIVGQLIAKIPGAQWIGSKVKPFLEQKLARRTALTDNPARTEAVEELTKRTGKDFVVTPGQVTGEAGATESAVRRASPRPFHEQSKALNKGADDMLRETTTPAGQMDREALGETITRIATETQQALKNRLRPTWQAADNLGVMVDVSPVRIAASKALRKEAAVAGGKMKASELAEVEKVFEHLRVNPRMTPEATLDFISRRKEIARANTADGVPSKEFTGLMNQMAGLADGAYRQAAKAIPGGGQVVSDLLRARRQYGDMIDTVYEDAMKQALKKVSTEDIGRLFWQPGNVTEIKQLHRMLRLAEREGTLGAAGAMKIKHDVARGFLQEGVRDVESAAKWMTEMKQNPLKRDTWNALTHGADGQALRHAMEVVSEASQMASKSAFDLAGGTILPIQRAASMGMGSNLTTGTLKPGLIALGFSIIGVTRMMATAYTRGDKGTINLMARVIRENSLGTAASTKAVQQLLPQLIEKAKEYGEDDLIVEGQPDGR
jgi:hypothetical protein